MPLRAENQPSWFSRWIRLSPAIITPITQRFVRRRYQEAKRSVTLATSRTRGRKPHRSRTRGWKQDPHNSTSTSTESEEDTGATATVVVRNVILSNYLLPNALVFALFGKLATSANRNNDVDLELSDAPPGRKGNIRGAAGGSPEDEQGGSSSSDASSGRTQSKRSAIRLMVDVGEAQSRKQAKESTQQTRAERNFDIIQREILEVLISPDPQRAKLIDHVE